MRRIVVLVCLIAVVGCGSGQDQEAPEAEMQEAAMPVAAPLADFAGTWAMRAMTAASLAGVVFLSGGQSDIEATAHLDAMNRIDGTPWPLSFSYGRALQAPALAAWSENPADNISIAQRRLLHRSRMNGLAALGEWAQTMESDD